MPDFGGIEILRRLLNSADYSVIGSAATGEEGLRLIERIQPTAAVIDYELPEMTGAKLECLPDIGHRANLAPVVARAVTSESTPAQVAPNRYRIASTTGTALRSRCTGKDRAAVEKA